MIDDNSVIEPEDQFGPSGEAYREIIREQKMLIAEFFQMGRFPRFPTGTLGIEVRVVEEKLYRVEVRKYPSEEWVTMGKGDSIDEALENSSKTSKPGIA